MEFNYTLFLFKPLLIKISIWHNNFVFWQSFFDCVIVVEGIEIFPITPQKTFYIVWTIVYIIEVTDGTVPLFALNP